MDFYNNYSAVNESATDFTLRQTEVTPPQYKPSISHTTRVSQEPNKVSKNENIGFPIPQNAHANVILIGSFADTKAVEHFLQQRLLAKATGKNWYFLEYEDFGKDIGYQIELFNYKRLDMLSTIDVVYPRINTENLFIQSRLVAKSAAIFNWLRNGSYIYVGTLYYDVRETLIRIIQREGRLSQAETTAYLDDLQRQKRYAQFVEKRSN